MPEQVKKPTQRVFNGGLWIAGGKDNVPDTGLRRAEAVNALKTTTLRSRNGATQVTASLNAHSLFRFNGLRFEGASTIFYKNGVSIKTGLNGNRLTFAKMPPQVGDSDYLFVAGGGVLFKVDGTGAVTNWGIAAPVSNPTLATLENNEKQILKLNDAVSNWTVQTPANGSISLDTSYFQEYDGSLKVHVNKNVRYGIKRSVTIDLTKFATATWQSAHAYTADATDPENGSVIVDSNNNTQVCTTSGTSGGSAPTWNTAITGTTTDNTAVWTNYGPAASTTADLIEFWLGVDEPDNLSHVEVAFSLHDTTFHDMFVYNFDISTSTFTGTPGVNSVLGGTPVDNIESTFVKSGVVPGVGPITDPKTLGYVLSGMNKHRIPPRATAWALMTASKTEFTRNGGNLQYDWSNVAAVRFHIKSTANGPVNVWLNALELAGGVGMQGTYQYAVVFANTITASVSNPQPIGTNNQFATIQNVQRGPVKLTSIPTSADAQVNARVLYRTLGNGSLLFYLDIINDNSTTTYIDTVADFVGANGGNEPIVLGTTATYPIQLETDNTPPAATYARIAGPFQGCMFWCGDSGHPGRLYFSPAGRPEAVESYIDITFNDDPLQMPIIWNEALWVLSQKRLFRILPVPDTSITAFVYDAVTGAKGTLLPFSAVAGKNYLLYQSPEGLVMFDGNLAQPAGMSQLGPIFRGESAENLVAMSTVTSAYCKGEFYLSDAANQTLILNEAEGTWRSLGVPLNCVYYEDDLGDILATLGGNVVVLDVPGQYTDNSAAIPFQVETRGLLLGLDISVLVTRLVLDINTANQIITPELIINDSTTPVPLPSFATAARKRVEYTLALPAQTVSVRLSGQLGVGIVEVFSVELEVEAL